MNTAVMTIRTETNLKVAAQRAARELGFSISSLINAYLRQLIKTKTVYFSAAEEPSGYLIQAIREAEEELKAGWVSPKFDNAKEAIAWLRSKRKTYARQLQ